MGTARVMQAIGSPKSEEYFTVPLISRNGFREYDVRWLIDKELNYQGLRLLGQAFGTMLQREFQVGHVVVGFDYRKYSQNAKNALVVGLLSAGMDVVDIGLVLTPVTYFAQHALTIKGCAMITASHNENGWTGIKLGYDLSRTFGPEHIERYRAIVEAGDFVVGSGTYREAPSIRDEYVADFAGRAVGRPLKVVVATGNGTAGLFTPKIMRTVGCHVHELDTELDWDFPKFNPNPEGVAFLKAIGDCVRAVGADLGIGVDGDGDRLGIVDERGEEVFSDKIGLLVARDLAPRHPGATFVVDVKSTGLFFVDDVLRRAGAKVLFSKTGHSYVKSAVHAHGALAGFEKSGHFVFNRPIGRGYDDANVAAVHVCQLVVNGHRSLSQLLAALPKSHQSPTMSPPCPDDKKYEVVERATESYRRDLESRRPVAGRPIKELITVNGVRAVLDDGSWALIRASSNLPCLSIVAESFGTKRQLHDLVDDIKARLRQFPEVGALDQELAPYAGEESGA